jgi:hypothetical protein
MNNGWIKLHRKLKDWEWYHDSKMVHLFVHLLLSANHEDNKWQGIVIKRGQLITGRHKLHENTGISEQSIRTCLNKLKLTTEITIMTTNKNSIITLANYEQYQCDNKKLTNVSTNISTNNQPTNNHKQEKNNINKENNNMQAEPADTKTVSDINIPEKINTGETSKSPIIVQEKIIPALTDQTTQIITLFRKINKALQFQNKTERKAISDLINECGFQKARGWAEYAIRIQGVKFAPQIITPYQLWNKLTSLKNFKKNNYQIYEQSKSKFDEYAKLSKTNYSG